MAGKIASKTKNETPPAIDNRQSRIHLAVGAPKNVVPAPPENLQRMGGVTAAAVFVRPADLEVARFLGALRLAERPFLIHRPQPFGRTLTAAPRIDGTNINSAVAPTLSQKGKSGRFPGICFSNRALATETTNARARGFVLAPRPA